MFKNTIKQFLYVTLQEKTNAINILGKYAYCAGGSIARNSGAVNKKLTIQGECVKAIPHNSKCRYGERGTAAAKPKAQIILDAAKVSAASGGNSEPKQGQRSQSARSFCPRSTMRVPQPDIIEHFGNADAVRQLPERCLSRKAGIVRCCLICDVFFVSAHITHLSYRAVRRRRHGESCNAAGNAGTAEKRYSRSEGMPRR